MLPCVPFIAQCNSAVIKNMLKGADRGSTQRTVTCTFPAPEFKKIWSVYPIQRSLTTNLIIRGLIPPKSSSSNSCQKAKSFLPIAAKLLNISKKLTKVFFVVQQKKLLLLIRVSFSLLEMDWATLSKSNPLFILLAGEF